MRRVKLSAELRQLLVRLGVVLEEGILGLRVLLEGGGEARVLVQHLVGGEPEQVVILHGLLVLGEVAVVESQPVLSPGGAPGHARAWLAVLAHDAGGLRVLGGRPVHVGEGAGAAALLEGAADSVGAGEGNDLLVGEAHLLGEDVAEVRRRVTGAAAEGREGVRQASVAAEALARGGAGALVGRRHRHAAVLHPDLRATGRLDGHGGGHLDDVRPGDGRVLLLEPVEVSLSLGEAGVCAHVDLRIEADGAVGAPALRPLLDALVVGAGVVPGEAHQDGVAVEGVHEFLEVLLQCLQVLHARIRRAEGSKATLRAGVAHRDK
mmetsp:Transcript_90891/g.257345  ORF Transcript_90891/g.257345 Transcript_90891/m.257345 type:complete len:321 (-) Transcript_90891:61-1023(-)